MWNEHMQHPVRGQFYREFHLKHSFAHHPTHTLTQQISAIFDYIFFFIQI